MDRAHKSKNNQMDSESTGSLSMGYVGYVPCAGGFENCLGHPILNSPMGVKDLIPGPHPTTDRYRGVGRDISRFTYLEDCSLEKLFRLGMCPHKVPRLRELGKGVVKSWAEESAMLTDALDFLIRGNKRELSRKVLEHWHLHRALPPQAYLLYVPHRHKIYVLNQMDYMKVTPLLTYDEVERKYRADFNANLYSSPKGVEESKEQTCPDAPARVREGVPTSPNYRENLRASSRAARRAMAVNEAIAAEESEEDSRAGAGAGAGAVPRKVSRRRTEVEMLRERVRPLYDSPKLPKRRRMVIGSRMYPEDVPDSPKLAEKSGCKKAPLAGDVRAPFDVDMTIIPDSDSDSSTSDDMFEDVAVGSAMARHERAIGCCDNGMKPNGRACYCCPCRVCMMLKEFHTA